MHPPLRSEGDQSSLQMDLLVSYSIPVRGLRAGTHEFAFRINREFFQAFEHSPVADGSIELTLRLDKRPDMYLLEFDFAGTLKTECDRCLASIDLPVRACERLIVKFSELEEVEEADVVYIHPEAQQLNVAKYIYEYVILAMPFVKVYDCENDPHRVCNEDMLRYLQHENGNSSTLPAAEPEETNWNPFWEELRKLDIKDN